jgi:hypothetical protein
MEERALLRIGAVSLAAGLVAAVVFELLHPSREDPNNNRLVFAEYAADSDWTTVHLGHLAGALLLIGGLVSLCGSLAGGRAVSAAWGRLATAAAITAAAAYGVLQVVDGVALKRAVDAWAAAPAEEKAMAFRAAQTVRWTEYGMNSLTFILIGLTLLLIGVAMLTGDRFPRWLGAWAIAAGLGYGVKGLGVAYHGFAGSLPGLVALVVFGTWVITMVVVMWRRGAHAARPVAEVASSARPVAATPASGR